MGNFNGKLSQQAWMIAPETLKLMQVLNTDGGEARFVGGCVRDTLVNRKVVDIDIATTLKPDDVIERLKKNKIKFAPTGLDHGTVTAIVEGHPFEVTTLRKDIETFGRHAEVEFTDSWLEDAERRDFTINAMSANIEGDVFDPFNGIEDLRLGHVRFVGDAKTRIEEDVLRILRFFRFHAHFGKGEADAVALKACKDTSGEIKNLSIERITHEVFKILSSDNSADVWQLMLDNNIVESFLPEAKNTKALSKLIKLEYEHQSEPFVLRRFAALLDVTAEKVLAIGKHLRFSKEQTRNLVKMVKHLEEISLEMDEVNIKKQVYLLGNDMVRNLLLLKASKVEELGGFKKLYEVATSFRAPRFPLVGNDILVLGVKPGPEVGQVLSEVEEWWLEKDFVPNREECLKILSEKADVYL